MHSTSVRAACLGLTLCLATGAQAASHKPPIAKGEIPTFPLGDVIAQTEAALNQYNHDPDTVQGALPYLTSADFDFKTVTQQQVGGKFTFLIFSIGASRTSAQTSDADFLYQAPPQPASPSTRPAASKKAEPTDSNAFVITVAPGYEKIMEALHFNGASFAQLAPADSHSRKVPTKLTYSDNLINTLKSAAQAVQDQQDALGKNPSDAQAVHFCSLSVTLGFGIQYDVNGGASTPVATLVTVGLNVDANKNTTQTVKLTFKATKDQVCKQS